MMSIANDLRKRKDRTKHIERMAREHMERRERMQHMERTEPKKHMQRIERIKRMPRRKRMEREHMERIKHMQRMKRIERMQRMDRERMERMEQGLEGRTALFGRKRCSQLIDVYIKYRDPLVKQTLTTQLYNNLHLLGLMDFLESRENEFGNSFSSILKIAIHSAKVHIAIFSKSSRCLADVDLLKMAELVRMLESNCKSIPVVYYEELQKLRQRNCQMSKNPVGLGLHNQVKEFKRGRFGQLVQNLEKQCTLQGKKRRKP